ncbi:hypothetical protein [Pseudomonas rhodesiae]|uniref:hypothetical protein n=1 Tax=Pseudomonas rhodesiae TaxID=76760 RepID=UPI001F2CADDA|nr:hypothetical protein [Pseudomonas rhodesiae]
MKNDSLEVSVAEFVKGVDDIFERQLKLMDELRESFRLIAEAMQKSLHPKELPPLEEIGVNKNHLHRKVTTSEISRTKFSSPPVQL